MGYSGPQVQKRLMLLQGFFDSSKDLDTMIVWLRQATQILPKHHSDFLLFCTLTGLRASECIEAVSLLRKPEPTYYYNQEQNVLQHYRFPDIFIRRTKAVYISIVDDEIIKIAKNIKKTPTLNALKMITMHRSLNMRLKYCRKIYASWLHKSGESSDLIDMLQGRIGKNIFVKHYLTPDSSFKNRILAALHTLMKEIEQ
jgi:intergrase/recombinase